MFALVRNMGQGIGISIVTAVLSSMMQVNHEELASRVTAASGAVATQMPGLLTGNAQVVSVINGLVTQQSAMLSYLDDFWLMMLLSISAVPLILLLRGARKPPANAPQKSAEEKALERAHAMAE
jgi:DHA2 family multidrug resistance protein